MCGQQLCAPHGVAVPAGFTALPGCGWLLLVGYTGGPTCYLAPSPQALGGGQSPCWLHSFAGLRLAVLLKEALRWLHSFAEWHYTPSGARPFILCQINRLRSIDAQGLGVRRVIGAASIRGLGRLSRSLSRLHVPPKMWRRFVLARELRSYAHAYA